MTSPLDLRCQGYPSDRQTRKARRAFGEGFTWTCPHCGETLVLVQGKGTHWSWQPVRAPETPYGGGQPTGSEMHLLEPLTREDQP